MEQVSLFDRYRCSRCKGYKNATEFRKNKRAASGLFSWCRPCVADDARARRRDDPAYQAREEQRRLRARERSVAYWLRPESKARAREYDRSRRDWVGSLKARPCADCGGRFPPCAMDFDHRPGETKAFNVASITTGTRDKILSEIAKCDLVCSNCHRIRTYNRRIAAALAAKAIRGTT